MRIAEPVHLFESTPPKISKLVARTDHMLKLSPCDQAMLVAHVCRGTTRVLEEGNITLNARV